MALNLFIDTNILLAFYHFSGEDLEELKKLAVLLKNDQAQLFLPVQVVDEFNRNRDRKIADATRRLREQKLGLQYPQMCKDYAEYATLRELQKQFESAHAVLLEKVLADAAASQLKADSIIDDLFSQAHSIPRTVDIVGSARLRVDIGNPPGKTDSLGDAVNWESLLKAVPDGEPLHFVTDDKDYASPLDKWSFNSFLLDEWTGRKHSELVSYRRLSTFFAAEYPDIKLASEIEKDLAIQDLATSPNFTHTHKAVARLRQFPEFTVDQANAILAAAVNNSQVTWITHDWDVRELLKETVEGKEAQLDSQLLSEVLELIGPD